MDAGALSAEELRFHTNQDAAKIAKRLASYLKRFLAVNEGASTISVRTADTFRKYISRLNDNQGDGYRYNAPLGNYAGAISENGAANSIKELSSAALAFERKFEKLKKSELSSADDISFQLGNVIKYLRQSIFQLVPYMAEAVIEHAIAA